MNNYREFAEALLAGKTLVTETAGVLDCIALNDDGIMCRTLDFKYWDSSEISLIDADVTKWEILK